MELFSPEFWSALFTVIMVNLVLAGDNAILIGLAARNVPQEQRNKVIVWGTVGAIIIRVIGTLAVVYILKIPGLLLIGGLLLVYIAYKLMLDEENHSDMSGLNNFWKAVRTIIIADALMGIDNVVAVAGAANGNFWLVVIGLTTSVPIVVWGSTLILKAIERFPIIITIGSGVLAYTAAKMLIEDNFVHHFFESVTLKYGFEAFLILLVLTVGYLVKTKRKSVGSESPNH